MMPPPPLLLLVQVLLLLPPTVGSGSSGGSRPPTAAPAWRGPAAAPLPRSNAPLAVAHAAGGATEAGGELSLQQLVQQLDGVLTSQGAAKRAGGTELLAPLPWPCCECSAVTAASAATPAPRGRLTGCQLCGAWLEWLTSRRLASRSPLAAALLSTVRPTGLRLELALLCCTLRRAVGREG
jgi:hypothetical protein